jgi:hypothetical protein
MRHCPASVRSKQFATVAAHVLYMCLHRRVPTMLACALSCRSIPPQSTPRKRHSCWLPRDRRLSTACVQVGTDTMGERHLQPLPLPLTMECTSPFHSGSSAAMGGMAACASWATSAPRLLANARSVLSGRTCVLLLSCRYQPKYPGVYPHQALDGAWEARWETSGGKYQVRPC